MVFTLCKIVGQSMSPTLESGDFVIGYNWKRNLGVSDLVIADHPFYGRIIKRVIERCSVRGFRLAGDHTLSTSTDQLGWVKPAWVKAKVFLLVKRTGVEKV